jgi:hypothetical protein
VVEEGRPEDEVGRARGLFRVVMGGREVVVEELVVLLAVGCRTEAERPRPKTPETGRLRDVGAPLLSSVFLTAVEAVRVVREEAVDAVGSRLGDTVRALLWLSGLEHPSFFWPSSPPAGFRSDRDRDNNDDMPTRSTVVACGVCFLGSVEQMIGAASAQCLCPPGRLHWREVE